ncbi:MAG: HIT domain-containing protein [Chloroflexi bacterium]|nr:HIT domain-containing protein [Chloroflexota bacterium]
MRRPERSDPLTLRTCVFCEIIARRAPGEILYEDDHVVVFRNVLRWVPVMLLAVPRQHLTQAQLWADPIIARVARVAAEAGARHCPNGFRLLANFGQDALQTQEHGHVHVLGGTRLGLYS